MKDLKFAELCRYVTMTNTVIYPFAVIMNRDTWDALPEEVKKVMEDLGTEQARWTGTYMDNQSKGAVEWSKKTHQVEFITIPEGKKAEWEQRLEPVIQKWVKEAKGKGLPAEAIVEDIKALSKKYAEQ
jgi:TRAP-type C4-dicarboxylate transport system substrate-binding protein